MHDGHIFRLIRPRDLAVIFILACTALCIVVAADESASAQAESTGAVAPGVASETVEKRPVDRAADADAGWGAIRSEDRADQSDGVFEESLTEGTCSPLAGIEAAGVR